MPNAASDPRTQTSPVWVKLNGEELSEDIVGQIVELRIEQDLVLPDAFTLRILDIADQARQAQQENFPLLEGDKFAIGKSIEIGLGHEEKPAPVLKGDITSLEMEAHGNGRPMLTVRGYDASYRLHLQRQTKTYLKVSDAELVQQIAARNGLTAKVDATSVRYDHVFQDNQTDWQFLRGRAAKVGYELFVQDRNLVFRKPAANDPPPQLTFGETLYRVRLRLSGTSQVSRVVVKSWDPKTKQTIQVDATRPSQRAQIGGDAERKKTLAGLVADSQAVFPRQTVATEAEARELAQAHYDAIAGDFIRLEAVAPGHAGIKPGRSVKFKNLGVRFDHEYYVSSAVHRVTPAEGYTTELIVGGRRPPTLMDLLSGGGHDGHAGGGGGGGGAGAGKQQGVVVGIVTNNKDDEMGGRVKVKYPWLGDEESHWARLVTPMAGSGRGMYFLPEVGDEVIVALEHGDINHAYVLGGVWNGQEKPPKAASEVVDGTGKVNQRILQSRLGHTITLDDSVDKPGITIVDKTGQNSIRIDSQTNKVSIKVMGDISLEAPQGTISIKGMGVQIEATGPAKVKGATTGIEASGPVTVRGATVSIN
jgi:phage protein D/phage baseplate assembly protein gpV